MKVIRTTGSLTFGALRISAGADASRGPPELDEGASSLRCEPKTKKHLRPRPTLVRSVQALVGLKDVRVLRLQTPWPRRRTGDRAGGRVGPLSRLRGSGPGEGTPGGALRRPPVYGTPMRWRGRSTACVVRTRPVRRGAGCSRTTGSRPSTACSRPGRPSGRRARSAPGARSQRWPPSSPATGTRSTTP